MFRPNTVAWMKLVAGLGLAAALPLSPVAAQAPTAAAGQPGLPAVNTASAGSGAVPAAPAVLPPTPPLTPPTRDSGPSPLPGRPAQAHDALNQAIENQRRGNFEAAAPLFQEAKRRQLDLTAVEQAELSRLMLENSQALQARHDGHEHLRLADKAFAEGRAAEGQERLTKIALNEQYLTPADRQQFQALSQSARGRPGAADLARERVKEARSLLTQFRLDEAEHVAKEADQLNQVYSRKEDAPRDVLRDVNEARGNPKTLLQAGRAALQRKDFAQAEHYAELSSKISSSWSLNPFADSPAKVLKDIQAARQGSLGRDGNTIPKGAGQPERSGSPQGIARPVQDPVRRQEPAGAATGVSARRRPGRRRETGPGDWSVVAAAG